ncbi:MAG: hypothetical protein R6T90_05005 [Dissulfuribacterales bacterium]
MTEKRKAFEEKLDAQIKELSAQMALLKTKADKAKAEAKIEYYTTIEALHHKRDIAKAKLHELKTSGEDAWDNLKAGTEKAWDEFKSAFHAAASKFK